MFDLSSLKLTNVRKLEVVISGNQTGVTRVKVQAQNKAVIISGPTCAEVIHDVTQLGYTLTDKPKAHKMRPDGSYYNVLIGTREQTAQPQPMPRNMPRVRQGLAPTPQQAARTLKAATAEVVEAARVLKAHQEAEAKKAKRSAAARKGWETRKAAQQ